MVAVFSIWKDRIAPVFDVATQVAIVSKEPGSTPPILVHLSKDVSGAIVSLFSEYHASVLVCGAISRPLHHAVMAQGITVHSFVTGDLSEVIQAWRAGGIHSERFLMPGCGFGPTRRGGRNNRARQRRHNGRGGPGQGNYGGPR